MIEKFSIIGLWDERNYRISFKDGSLILVGENGSGKTTVLRILYYVLSRNWLKLFDEDFQRIELKSGDDELCILYSDNQGLENSYIDVKTDIYELVPFNIFNEIVQYCGEITTPEKLLEACRVYRIPPIYSTPLEHFAENKNNKISQKIREIEKWIQDHVEYPVVYLPTYRRSERCCLSKNYLDSRIKRHQGYEYLNSDLEVVKEGMKDVDETIKSKIVGIRNEYIHTSSELSAKCFNGILTREYDHVKCPEEIIKSDPDKKEYYEDLDSISTIFKSISEVGFASDNSKQMEERLLRVLDKDGEYDDYDKIVVYYYQMLIERFEHMKSIEESLEVFFYACNKYLTNKKIQYCPNEFKYEIVLDQENNGIKRTIDLDHLSSGEKQMVSLFSYLYLSNPGKCMVIIDEPELSLSVEWQQSILEDIILSKKCGSLIAATQSPFVYNNSLRHLARALDEFLTVG